MGVAESFHALPAGARLFALTTRTHSRATEVRVRYAATASDSTGALLHLETDWQHTDITTVADRTFTGSDGVWLSCTFTNPEARPIGFGDSSQDEQCNVLLYHR